MSRSCRLRRRRTACVPRAPLLNSLTGQAGVCNTVCPNIAGSGFVSGTVTTVISLVANVLPIDTLTCAYLTSDVAATAFTCAFAADTVRRNVALGELT